MEEHGLPTEGDWRDYLDKLVEESRSESMKEPKGWLKKRCPKCGSKLGRGCYGIFNSPKRDGSLLYRVRWCLSGKCDYIFAKRHVISRAFFIIR